MLFPCPPMKSVSESGEECAHTFPLDYPIQHRYFAKKARNVKSRNVLRRRNTSIYNGRSFILFIHDVMESWTNTWYLTMFKGVSLISALSISISLHYFKIKKKKKRYIELNIVQWKTRLFYLSPTSNIFFLSFFFFYIEVATPNIILTKIVDDIGYIVAQNFLIILFKTYFTFVRCSNWNEQKQIPRPSITDYWHNFGKYVASLVAGCSLYQKIVTSVNILIYFRE